MSATIGDTKDDSHDNHHSQHQESQLTGLRPGRPGNLLQLTSCFSEERLDRVGSFAFIFLGQSQTPSCLLRLKRRPITAALPFLQARQDLNPQPLVLETSALPIELLAFIGAGNEPRPCKLFCFAVRCVFPAARAILAKLHPIRIVAAILLGGVISLLTIITLKSNDRANILFLGSHSYLPTFSYSIILVTTPAPTVRPPSRMANLEPCSRATGTINSTVRLTLSPGITISTPSGRVMLPVTSIVRM